MHLLSSAVSDSRLQNLFFHPVDGIRTGQVDNIGSILWNVLIITYVHNDVLMEVHIHKFLLPQQYMLGLIVYHHHQGEQGHENDGEACTMGELMEIS